MSEPIKVFQIGPDGTEYYAARSEEEMREYYKTLTDTAEEDLRDYFEEVTGIDVEFDFNDDGEIKRMTWRKLAEEHSDFLPCQISTGYN
jgi:predicted house-cleaning noncanonical NTP pyrophosphatase (MazG superfamily)